MQYLRRRDTEEFVYKTETDPQIKRRNWWLPGSEGVGREFGIKICTHCYI